MRQPVLIQLMLICVLLLVGAIVLAKAGILRKSGFSTPDTTIEEVSTKPKAEAAIPRAQHKVHGPNSDPATPETPPVIEPSSNPFLRPEILKTRAENTWISEALVIDRVAAEVVDSLLDRPTLVVWLFDRTTSARHLRQVVAMHLQDVFTTLENMKTQGHDAFKSGPTALLSLVGAFSNELELLTPEPTADKSEVLTALRSMPESNDTEERPFSAIRTAIMEHAKGAIKERRRVLVVVVTDEAGDDDDKVDETLALLDKQAIPAYVIGVPAAFGRSDGLDPLLSNEHGKPLKQGPESISSEVVDIHEWQGSSEPLDSGFGPFALSRLCIKTGGVYFATREASDFGQFSFRESSVVRFDPKVMAAYRPDYVSKAAYQSLIDESKARTALLAAARLPQLYLAADLKTEFVKTDEAKLKRALDEAQRAAARMEPKLRELFTVISAGESERSKLSGARWQAGFDLAMGRVLATRTRIEGYNALLAQLKQGKSFPDPSHNTWVLEPTEKFQNDSTLERLVKQTHTYLDRVLQEHAGTPWAFLAKRELSSPLGWEWTSR